MTVADERADEQDAALASAITGSSEDYSYLDHLCAQCRCSGRSDCKFPMECENDGWGSSE